MTAVTAAVAGAGLLHAGWNAAAHKVADRTIGFALLGTGCAAVAAVAAPFVALPHAGAWGFLVGSVLVHLVYQALLIRSYDLGDFSQTYPIARGTSPLVVGIVAVTIVGQPLTAVHAAGLVTVSAGLALVGFGGLRSAHRPAVVAAVLTGLSIATYTVLDGVGVRHSGSTGGYIVWLFLLEGPVLPLWVAWRRGPRTTLRDCREAGPLGLASGAVSVAAYGIVIWAQTRAPLATVAATRELSILFGAIIGRVLFKERFGAWRIVGAIVTVVGIAVLDL